MHAALEFWNALDLTSTTSNIFLALVSTWLGLRAGVSWTRDQTRRDRLEERESLLKTIEFSVCDCLLAMRDGQENLRIGRPSHRALPVAGLEYFQIQAMRHSENDLFVGLATLRAQAEQANTLFPIILTHFTSSPIDSVAPADRPSTLQLHCGETLRRYEEVRSACEAVVEKVAAARKRQND